MKLDFRNVLDSPTNSAFDIGREFSFAEEQPMLADESYTGEETTKRRAPRRTWVYGVLIVFVLWLLLANHVIVVTEDPAFVILKKTSWTFNSCIIGESSWATFTLHHPVLMGRLATGDGFWIFGGEK